MFDEKIFDRKILGFAGYSGSGKTTLLEKLIPLLTQHGLRISVIKHAHHDFDIDQPGKDSYRHRAAGAGEVLIASSQRWAIMHELRAETEPTLQNLCRRLAPCDLVLVEGYKFAHIPKLEVHRKAALHPYLYPLDKHIIALVTDHPHTTSLPILNMNDPQQIVAFIMKYFALAEENNEYEDD